MLDEGPPLEALTRRLAECPPDFQAEPRAGAHGTVYVPAVVSDLLQELGGAPLSAAQAGSFIPAKSSQRVRNHLRLVLLGCWLLHDPAFAGRGAEPARRFLASDLAGLAELLPAAGVLSDPDRREEFARRVLRALDLRPAGETPEQALDRLNALDSLERQRVIRAAQEAEQRAREVREAMARQAAYDAQMKVTRE